MRILIFLILFLYACSSDPVKPPNKIEALSVAKKWFRLMDKGYFIKVYNDSSTILKGQLSESGWKRSFLYKKMVFGKKQKRVKTRDALLYHIRSFPPGAYTEIDYDAQYSKRGITRERLILRWEDGNWRVCGYTIM